MIRSKLFVCIISCFIAITSVPLLAQQEDLPKVTIGFIRDGPPERDLELMDVIKREILDLIRGEFDIRFPPEKILDGDWTYGRVVEILDELLADPEVDLIIGFGVTSSTEMCRRRDLSKPVIATSIVDPQFQGVPISDGASGIKNLSYLTVYVDPAEDIVEFLRVVKFKHLTALVDQIVLDSIPALPELAKLVSQQIGVKITLVGFGEDVTDALASIPEDADAVYLTKSHQSLEEMSLLIEGINERRLPSFSMAGREEVELGAFVGAAPATDYDRLARRVALHVQRILLGEDAGTLDVSLPQSSELTINMATARAIGFYPSYDVLAEAVLINEEIEEVERRLSLAAVIREAMELNLDLRVSDQGVSAGEQEVRRARSQLLPRIDMSATGLVIDADRAAASFGSQPQRSLTGSIDLTQVIYSEEALANLGIQKSIQHTRELQHNQLRLDIALEAGTAYLNILKAKAFERIQKDNLRLTRSNLELARMRESIGLGGPEEVYRWESQLASSRKAVLDTSTQRRMAEMELNRILDRPLEQPFATEETGIEDMSLSTFDGRVYDYTDNPLSFKIFRDFMELEAVEYSPEIQAIDAAIAIQRRILDSAYRSYWSPTVAVKAALSGYFAKGGAGLEGLDLGPLPFTVPVPDEVSWHVGLSVSLPLYKGDSRSADLIQATEELDRLRIERRAVETRIKQRTRSVSHLARASHTGIKLARDAAEAARKNLELATDAYSRGVVSILELIDAQNANLVAEQAEAGAVYDYLIDLLSVERAGGQFAELMSEEERSAKFKRLEEYFRQAGVAPAKQK